jgi:hypothetical protein
MNWYSLHEFVGVCHAASVDVPQPIVRGMELMEVAKVSGESAPGDLLALTDDQVLERVTDLSIRRHQGPTPASRGLAAGIDAFGDDLLAEVREATLPELDTLIVDLRPRFDEAAAPLVAAVKDFGFTFATTSNDVIDLANEKASAAWRDARTAWHALTPLVRIRTKISDLFHVSPTPEEAQHLFYGDVKVDYTVAFAAGDNWSYDGNYYVNGETGGTIDWFALAARGLRLNTPDEVRVKQDRKATGAH